MRRLLFVTALLAACATTPQATPAPTATIEIQPMRGNHHFRAVTHGLDPALAIEGVEEADLPLAEQVLEAALAAFPVGEEPHAGTALDLTFGPVGARVQLVSAAGPALLVIDLPPGGTGVAPRGAMASAAFARAWEAWQRGDPAEARRWAHASVRLHPGDPLEATDSPEAFENGQNHLAWALLALISDGAEQRRWYVGAIERSPRFLAAQLGATPSALLEADRGELEQAAREIVESNLQAQPRDLGSGVVEIPAPIWTEPRQSSVLPLPFLGLYFTEPAASLLADDAFRAVAVDAFERLRTDPVRLLLATWEIRSLYLQQDLFAAPPSDGRPCDQMLSAVLADVARKGAAGLTPDEITATLDGPADPALLASARRKLRDQRDRETLWYAAALQSGD